VAAVDRVAAFEGLRPRLRGLAYRMLGSVGDAEDAVQDAYLRWLQADGGAGGIRSPEAWLVTVVTRLCLDRLRALAAERAAYDGPWLPEPWPEATDEDGAPGRRLERAADLSLAFLALLERLSPEERAALLLREVFDVGYPEIARTLGKAEAACRQMVHRARERVRQDRARHHATEAARRRLVRQFLDAANAGDQAALLRILAPDAAYVTDGGGQVWALRRIVRGAERIARLLAGVARKRPGWVHEPATVNGEAGYLTYEGGRLVGATAVATDGERILAVLRVLNPDKLRRLAERSPVG
jgi:RNA polymerase sigma-70 factor, ECF subfamily